MAEATCRRATIQDAAALTGLFQNFYNCQVREFGFAVDYDGWFAGVLNRLANDPGFAAFVADIEGRIVGACLVEIRGSWFAWWQKVGSELGWWMETEYRKGRTAFRLLDAAEKWLIGQGASMLVFTALANSPEGVERFYRKRGYRPMETHYLKVV